MKRIIKWLADRFGVCTTETVTEYVERQVYVAGGTIYGDLHIVGDLSVDGNISATGEITAHNIKK